MDQQQRAVGEEPVHPAGLLRRGRADRQRPVQPVGGVGDPPGVPQDPHHPADQQAVHVGAVDQSRQRGQPPLLRRGRLVGAATGGQRDGGLHRVDVPAQRGRAVLVEAGHRLREPGADPQHQGGADPRQLGDVGAPHVAVALRPHQGRQRLHQVQHVGVDRGPLVERAEQRRRGLGQVGLQAGLQHPGQHGQRGLGRRSSTRAAVAAGTVVPHTAASTTDTEARAATPAARSRGRCRCCARRWSPGAPSRCRAAAAGGTAWSAGGRRGGAGRGRGCARAAPASA